MSFTHDEYLSAMLGLERELNFTAEAYLEALLGLTAEFAFVQN